MGGVPAQKEVSVNENSEEQRRGHGAFAGHPIPPTPGARAAVQMICGTDGRPVSPPLVADAVQPPSDPYEFPPPL